MGDAGFKFAAARGEMATFSFPGRPGVRGGVCQRAAVADERGADAVTAEDDGFFEFVAVWHSRGIRLGARGDGRGSEGGDEKGLLHGELRFLDWQR